MSNENKILDYSIYNERMNKSLLDKVFFLDKIDTESFVDYGCGDGTLLDFIGRYVGFNVSLLGYDNDTKMIQEAEKRISRITFASDWNELMGLNKTYNNSSTTLILSSVIHEIYHYSSPKQIDKFWSRVFGSNFSYICIRDMIPSRSISRFSDINDVAKVYNKFLHKQELTDFENIWGSIENNKNLIHFLLKYKYLEPNWAREVKENYMPLYREDFLSIIDVANYEIIYHEHFALPYLKSTINSDLGIELKDCTHLKLILKKKN